MILISREENLWYGLLNVFLNEVEFQNFHPKFHLSIRFLSW